MMRTKRIIVQVTVVVALLLSAAGCIVIHDGEWDGGPWSQRARFERTVELQHALPPGAALVVSTASGSIEATGGQTDEAQVVATIRARAATEDEARELAEQVEIRFQEAGSRVEIRADLPPLRHRSISISYRITQPRQTGIDCDSASGSIRVAGLDGGVKAHTASGSVRAERIKGAVRLHSASGSVYGEEVGSGDVDLDTASGGVTLTNASDVGTCRLHTASGSAHARHVKADSIYLDSGSGGVTADDVDCPRLTGKSGSGNVSVTFFSSAPKDVVVDTGTGSGSISVALPSGFAGRVELSTSSGSIDVDLPVTIRGSLGKRNINGSIGEGNGRLSAHTGSGSIHIR